MGKKERTEDGREVPFEQLTLHSSHEGRQERLPEIGRLSSRNMADGINFKEDQRQFLQRSVSWNYRRARNHGQAEGIYLELLFFPLFLMFLLYFVKKIGLFHYSVIMSFPSSDCKLFEGVDYVFNF